MNKNLLILGAGQYSSVIKEIAQELGFEKIAFLSEFYGKNNPNFHEQPIVGDLSDYEQFLAEYSYAVSTAEKPELRLEQIKKLEESGYIIPVLVSKKAYVSPSAVLQKGVVIEPLASIGANSCVGAGTYVMAGAVISHNAVVEDGCRINSGTVVMSTAWVRARTGTKPCETICSKTKASSKCQNYGRAESAIIS